MKRFKNRIAVITGAGSGLGQGLALEFAKMHWKIACCDIDPARAEESVRLVQKAGGEGLPVQCDVTKHEQVQELADRVLSAWGGADVIVNNAGVPVIGFFEKISLQLVI